VSFLGKPTFLPTGHIFMSPAGKGFIRSTGSGSGGAGIGGQADLLGLNLRELCPSLCVFEAAVCLGEWGAALNADLHLILSIAPTDGRHCNLML
jgi:hypothetical protein